MEYTFDQIAYNSTEKKLPEDTDRAHYIGLEHLDYGCFEITRWGSDVTPTGEKLVMHKGDILFGKRRAYQRKVGIAPFDGIFSAHGMVLRPKENVVNKDYFPFFIASDQFMERAVRISVGGLSPTINWKDLKEQVFDIPAIEEQQKLAEKLWSAYRLKESYKKLLVATDEMVKSRFIEMFSSEPKMSLSEVSKITMGSSPDSKYYNLEKQGLPFYQGKTEFGDMYIGEASVYCKEPVRIAEPGDILMSVRAPVGTVNFNVIECCIGRGLASIRPKRIIEPLYLFYALRLKEADIDALGTGSTFKAINKDTLFSFKIEVGNKAQQNEFVHFAEQADKSKFELKQAIEKIDKVMRALMQ